MMDREIGRIVVYVDGTTIKAYIRLRQESVFSGPGPGGEFGLVKGQNTEDGPWIDGEGRTVEDAIRNLFENLGRLAFYTIVGEVES